MSDDSAGVLSGLDLARAALVGPGYLLTSDHETGLAGFRGVLLSKYFNDSVLRRDAGDWPADRRRARDIVGYQWCGGSLRIWEHNTITITDRAGIPGKREHNRVWLLDDPGANELVRTFLSLIPPDRRQPTGTFGVNLFRTLTDVVSKPHHDDEEFIFLYVLNRVGGGAESYLYRPGDVDEAGQPTADPIFRRQLNPGDILIFEDERFKHGATPLVPPLGGKARRDVLVCTVDYRSTYLEPAR